MYYNLAIVGIGLSVGIIRCLLLKNKKRSKKLKYYNYSKYAIKYKKINSNINQQTKSI
jgi:hypothetical protein